MIKNLSIRNYALIDKLEIDIFEGFNIITGETGAGKSILLGSLELAMGKRADVNVLFNKEESCVVELEYDIKDYGLKDFFIENDLEYSDEITITRSINPAGKSRAFINDVPVNLNVLKELTEQLILMHRQFDNLELNKPDYQLKIIDNFGDNCKILEHYKILFNEFKKQKSELFRLTEERDRFSREIQFLQFQLNELKSARLDFSEYQTNLDYLNNLNNAENIKRTLFTACNELTEGELSIIGKLEKLIRELNTLDLIGKEFSESKESLTDIIERLNEISNHYLHVAEESDYDEEKIFELKERIDMVNSLIFKYKVSDIQALIEIQLNLELKLEKHFNVDAEIAGLGNSVEKLNHDLKKISIVLNENRKKAAQEFSKQIEKILHELALPHTRLKILIETQDEFTVNGCDKITFLFSANKGSDFKPLKEVVSGGELSRLALSIESAIAGKMSLPTLIFDEIEAGISGEVARKMGLILKQMSKKHQIINITHSPQIAAKADFHFFVYKNSNNNKTFTNITLLDKAGQITELAKMLSGDPPTEGAIKNAIELIENE
jgi:DNA repair protein RecN (Recombination protein N)